MEGIVACKGERAMERILVVDDEIKIRAIIRKYGEFEGYEIVEAEDGMEAIEICKKQAEQIFCSAFCLYIRKYFSVFVFF